jgi:uncharacterized protein (TIGR03435 family)
LDPREWYDVQAIYPKGTPVGTIQLMVRTMLEERLGLKWHWEQRQAYGLVPAGKLNLEPATAGQPERYRGGPGMYLNPYSTLDDFAGRLTADMDRIVLNMTGIPGGFRLSVDESPAKTGKAWNAEEWFWIVRTLGLKLEPRKAPVRFLVIDHLNMQPTPN